MTDRIVAVLFDVDGVLIDSLAAHRSVWSAWARDHGLDEEVVWRATYGRRPEDTVALSAPGLDPAAERQLLDQLLSDHELGSWRSSGSAEPLDRRRPMENVRRDTHKRRSEVIPRVPRSP